MPTRSTTTDTVKYLANATTHLFLCHFTVSVGLYCEKKKINCGNIKVVKGFWKSSLSLLLNGEKDNNDAIPLMKTLLRSLPV